MRITDRALTLVLGTGLLAIAAGGCTQQMPPGWERLPPNAPRVEYDGVSFAPPQGKDWGRMRTTPPPDLVSYARYGGEAFHSLVAGVSVFYADAAKDTHTLYEEQIAALKSENQLPRFRNDRREFRIVTEKGIPCLRVDGPVEDIGSPVARGQPLELTMHDLHCRHPNMPGVVVSLSISERMKPGSTALLSPAEAEGFLSSLKLEPTLLRLNGVIVGKQPVGMAAGNGAVWVAVFGDHSVKRIDPASLRVTQTVETGEGTDGVAVTAEGTWAGASGHTVRLLDAVTAQTKLQVQLPATPSYMSASASSVWVTFSSAKQIAHIDPASGLAQVLALDARPEGVAASPDGAWVSLADPPAVTFVRGSPFEQVATVPLPEPQVPERFYGGAVRYAFGSVWVTDFQSRMLYRVDPATRSVIASIDVGQSPVGLAEFEGMLWVAVSGENSLVRVNPNRNTVIDKPILIGARPLELATAYRSLFVSLGNAGEVVRVVP